MKQHSINVETILHKFEQLIQTLKDVFPNAEISLNAIPPQNNYKKNQYIKLLNHKLHKTCNRFNIAFLKNDSLWMHVIDNGDIDKGIVVPDGIHFTDFGLSLFLRDIKRFFKLNYRRGSRDYFPRDTIDFYRNPNSDQFAYDKSY